MGPVTAKAEAILPGWIATDLGGRSLLLNILLHIGGIPRRGIREEKLGRRIFKVSALESKHLDAASKAFSQSRYSGSFVVQTM